MTKEKKRIWPERPAKKEISPAIRTDKTFVCYMKSVICFDKKRNISLAWMTQTIFRLERMLWWNKRNWLPIIDRSAHPQGGQNKVGKCSHGMDIYSKNMYDIVPQTWMIEYRKMYKISDAVINFIKKRHKKQESGINSGRDKPQLMWKSKEVFPRRFMLIIVISYSNDASQLYTEENAQWGLQIFKFTGQDKPHYVFGWYQNICQKWKKNQKPWYK